MNFARRPAALKVLWAGLAGVAGLSILILIPWVAVWMRGARNLALGRPVAASSAGFNTIPQSAVDGVRYGAIGFHSGVQKSDWWSVDLGRDVKISRIQAYGRVDCCFDQSIPLVMDVSLDGKNYREVARRTEEFSQYDPWVIRPKNVVARHVRFRTVRTTPLVLAEVEIYGSAK